MQAHIAHVLTMDDRGASRPNITKLLGNEFLILVGSIWPERLIDFFRVALGDRLIGSLRAGVFAHLCGLIRIFFGLCLWLADLIVIRSEYDHATVW
jgi:hypothetical protein